MRRDQFGFTIVRRFLGLALTPVFLFTFFGVMAEAGDHQTYGKVTVIPPTNKSKNDNSDEAEMTVQVTMHAWYTTTTYTCELVSEVSSDVHAAHEKKNTEYNCTGWIKGSADTYTRAIWPTENLKWEEKEDSQGREYHEGSYQSEDGVAYSGKKKHPVGHVTVSPTQERTRSLSLSKDGRLILVAGSPSQIDLDINPRARAEVKGTARNNVQATLAHIWAEVEGGG